MPASVLGMTKGAATLHTAGPPYNYVVSRMPRRAAGTTAPDRSTPPAQAPVSALPTGSPITIY